MSKHPRIVAFPFACFLMVGVRAPQATKSHTGMMYVSSMRWQSRMLPHPIELGLRASSAFHPYIDDNSLNLRLSTVPDLAD